MPSGVTQTDLKNRLRVTTLTERERTVCRLVLDTASPAEFTLTVKFITDSIGFSAAKVWPKVRDGLILKGILNAHSEKLGHGEKRWHLNFDFTVIASGVLDAPTEKLSTTQAQKGGSRARTCDPPQMGGSRNPPSPERLEPANLETKTTTFVVEDCLKRIKTGLQGAGIQDLDIDQILSKLSATSSQQQLSIYESLIVQRVVAANSPVAMATGLMRRAALGQLHAQPTATPTNEEQPMHPADFCAARSEWIGQLLNPDGQIACCRRGDRGMLRDFSGTLYSMARSQKIWLGVDVGALTFQPG